MLNWDWYERSLETRKNIREVPVPPSVAVPSPVGYGGHVSSNGGDGLLRCGCVVEVSKGRC